MGLDITDLHAKLDGFAEVCEALRGREHFDQNEKASPTRARDGWYDISSDANSDVGVFDAMDQGSPAYTSGGVLAACERYFGKEQTERVKHQREESRQSIRSTSSPRALAAARKRGMMKKGLCFDYNESRCDRPDCRFEHTLLKGQAGPQPERR